MLGRWSTTLGLASSTPKSTELRFLLGRGGRNPWKGGELAVAFAEEGEGPCYPLLDQQRSLKRMTCGCK